MKNNIFDKAYFDWPLFKTIELLAIQEGLITHHHETLGTAIKIDDLPIVYGNHRDKALLYITLFKNIDAPSTGFDVTKLINCGIITKESTVATINLNDERAYALEVFDKKHQTDFDKMIINQSRSIMVDNRTRIIRSVLNQTRITEYIDKHKYIPVYSDNKWHRVKSKKDIEWLFDTILSDIELTNDEEKKVKTIGEKQLQDFADELELMYLHFIQSMWSSANNNTVLVSSLTNSIKNGSENSKNIVDELIYTLRVNLSSEITILPTPRTIEEAIEFREKKELMRFREVMDEWIACIKSGNKNIEQKIRIDIQKANNEIKALKHWKEYKQSPIDFWINAIGGHIPIFSNVLTVVNMIGSICEKTFEKKTSWMMLSKR